MRPKLAPPRLNRMHNISITRACKGRLMPSSYAPDIGYPQHEPMLKKLREIYGIHQVNDNVTFAYDTLIYTTGCKVRRAHVTLVTASADVIQSVRACARRTLRPLSF